MPLFAGESNYPRQQAKIDDFGHYEPDHNEVLVTNIDAEKKEADLVWTAKVMLRLEFENDDYVLS